MVEKLLSISRSKQFKLLIGALGLFIAVMVVYFPNYSRLKKLRNENKRLSLENTKLAAEIENFEEKLKKVGKNSFLYEKIAREDLGVAKENEIVIDIGD